MLETLKTKDFYHIQSKKFKKKLRTKSKIASEDVIKALEENAAKSGEIETKSGDIVSKSEEIASKSDVIASELQS